MSEETSDVYWVGIDWATQKHDVCVVSADGSVKSERAFPNTGDGLAALAEWLVSLGDVRVSIEVPHGPVVDTLLERGVRVWAINPKQLDRFRDRFTTAGAKDDRRDARVLADSLRTDAQAFRELATDAPIVIELREWSRMNDDLKRERTALSNRMREQLRRFFPQFLELGGDLSEPWLLELLEAIPTPEAAKKRRVETVAKILIARRIRRVTADEVLRTLRQTPVAAAPGTVEAATAHIGMVSERLRVIVAQIDRCERKIDTLLDQLSASEATKGQGDEQRDVEILRSLPGVGRIVVATLLVEASRPLRSRDYHALRTLSGVAPVTRRSGKRCVVSMRNACATRLRNAVYHWARVASVCDPIWKARYRAFRERGHSHGHACRCVADRLLKVAVAMLQSGTPYDPARIRSAA